MQIITIIEGIRVDGVSF